jgi:hypothetical protein
MPNISVGHPGRLRWPVAGALLVTAAAHVPVTPDHLAEAPYMGVGFAAFTVAAGMLAVVVVRRNDVQSYGAAIGLCLAAVMTYAATRLVAFPQLGDDVGNWGERLGIVSIVSELAAIALSALALRRSKTVVDHEQGGMTRRRVALTRS